MLRYSRSESENKKQFILEVRKKKRLRSTIDKQEKVNKKTSVKNH